jgi:hypothetical protein
MSKELIGTKINAFALLNRQRSQKQAITPRRSIEKEVQVNWPRAALPQGTEWFKKRRDRQSLVGMKN